MSRTLGRVALSGALALTAAGGLFSQQVLAGAPGAWTRVSSPNSPPARAAASIAYDAAHGQLLIFGGITQLNGPTITVNDTWTWDGRSWTEQHPATSPPPASDEPMVFDPSTGNVVYVSKASCIAGAPGCVGTWTWDGSNWTHQSPATQPSCISALVYDAARGVVVGHGACPGLPGVREPSSEPTWTWDGTNWTLQSGTPPSPARYRNEMAYDPIHKQVVLFGGCHSGNDTWTWDGTNWTFQNFGPPSVRTAHK